MARLYMPTFIYEDLEALSQLDRGVCSSVRPRYMSPVCYLADGLILMHVLYISTPF